MAVSLAIIHQRTADVVRLLGERPLPKPIISRAVPSPLGVQLVFECPYLDHRGNWQCIQFRTLEVPVELDNWQHSERAIKAKVEEACEEAIDYLCPYLLGE